MNRDEIKGKGRNLKGRIKQALGTLTGHKRTEGEGLVERAGGAIQEGVGKLERETDERQKKGNP